MHHLLSFYSTVALSIVASASLAVLGAYCLCLSRGLLVGDAGVSWLRSAVRACTWQIAALIMVNPQPEAHVL